MTQFDSYLIHEQIKLKIIFTIQLLWLSTKTSILGNLFLNKIDKSNKFVDIMVVRAHALPFILKTISDKKKMHIVTFRTYI